MNDIYKNSVIDSCNFYFAALAQQKPSESRAVVLYVSQEDWIKSVLERANQKEKDVFSDDEEITDYPFEDDLDFLRSLDPKQWKDQDHYAVLGIKNLRNKATEDIIKRACKLKIYQIDHS